MTYTYRAFDDLGGIDSGTKSKCSSKEREKEKDDSSFSFWVCVRLGKIGESI